MSSNKNLSFHKYTILASVFTAAAMIVFCYIINNVGVSIGGEAELIKNTNAITSGILGDNRKPIPDSVVFISISYDKQLIEVDDEDGFPIGNIDITDRNKLYQFLDIASKADNYKYIFLDVFFEEGFNSPIDENLFKEISSMPRIVIPRHHDAILAHEKLIGRKSAISDYITTFFSDDYSKYQLINGCDTSVVLKMYNDITNHRVCNLGPFYFDDGRLCNKTLFTNMQILFDGPYDDNGNKNFYRLGSDILIDPSSITDFVKGRYIFIGDLEHNDIHQTVQGEFPGTVISSNIFFAILHEQHLVSWIVTVILFIVFYLFSWSIYTSQSLMDYIVVALSRWMPKINNTFTQNILSLLGYTSLLSILCLLFYYFFNTSYDIFFTAVIFQIINFMVSFIKRKNREKKKTSKSY